MVGECGAIGPEGYNAYLPGRFLVPPALSAGLPSRRSAVSRRLALSVVTRSASSHALKAASAKRQRFVIRSSCPTGMARLWNGNVVAKQDEWGLPLLN